MLERMVESTTVQSPKRYFAHLRKREDGSFEIHDLYDHLRAVPEFWRN